MAPERAEQTLSCRAELTLGLKQIFLIFSVGIYMRIPLFCIMAERTKHIYAQRSVRFSAERHKTLANETLAKRLVGETTAQPPLRAHWSGMRKKSIDKAPLSVRGQSRLDCM